MPECPKCHSQVKFSDEICSECGQNLKESVKESVEEKVASFMNTDDTTSEYSQEDINANKVMGVLSYLGILVLIPIFAAPKSRYARFHANQGLILLIVNVVLQLVCQIISKLPLVGFLGSILGSVVSLLCFILMILGIVNVVNGNAKELPIIGKYKLLK